MQLVRSDLALVWVKTRKGRRKERGKKGERQRKTERDSDKKDIGKDKREWKSMEV